VELVHKASKKYDREVADMRAYARFVSDVLNTCLRVDIDGKNPRIAARPVISRMFKLKRKYPGFAALWKQTQQLLDNQRYSVYVCARIADPSKNAYLLEEMHADGYPRKAYYVLLKTITFFGTHAMLDLTDSNVRAAFDAIARKKLGP
jgi:hypothetical protein